MRGIGRVRTRTGSRKAVFQLRGHPKTGCDNNSYQTRRHFGSDLLLFTPTLTLANILSLAEISVHPVAVVTMDTSTQFHGPVTGQYTIAAPHASHGGSNNFYFNRRDTSSAAPKPCRIIPFPRNEDVVYRPDLFAELEALLPSTPEYCSAALWGLGGSGYVMPSSRSDASLITSLAKPRSPSITRTADAATPPVLSSGSTPITRRRSRMITRRSQGSSAWTASSMVKVCLWPCATASSQSRNGCSSLTTPTTWRSLAWARQQASHQVCWTTSREVLRGWSSGRAVMNGSLAPSLDRGEASGSPA